ncbi:hypothetical protein EV646_101950 [Kribbella antiqua]|uniref:DUF308 domain-containing protein n=1 Tax=Kribbella antiqua TaxID=2512217 RepID=A0A4R2J213_9ACTN|nr:hypothetical protein [Kribbella antiqua]TCO51954.1 hypothetical protein EV646_101950 [Kribbella antiqua]
MRDNGLTAAAYTSLGGIDPLVAEPVLTALADAGIAAYCKKPEDEAVEAVAEAEAETSAEQTGDEPTESSPEATPAEQAAKPETAPAKAEARARIATGFEEIFVDSDAVERARPVIDRSTEDAEWQSLVEQFNAPSAPGHDGGDTPVPRWPVSEDVDDKYEPLIDVPAGLIIDDTDDEEEPEKPPKKRADDPHDHFVPPEPPRGPRLDWISRIAWLGLIGGPLLLIAAAVLDFGTGRITTIAVAGFIGGFLTLVIRMKDRLPPEDTPDDGAVV